METRDRVADLLEELVAWTRLMAREGLVKTLRETLTDPRHLKAYELSDGTRTQKQVGDEAGLSQPAVSALWQRWRRLGIVREKQGRASHLIRPTELGIAITGPEPSRTERTGRVELHEETNQDG